MGVMNYLSNLRVVYQKLTFFGIGTLNQWEKGIVLRLGKYSGDVNPGLFMVLPFIDAVYVTSTKTTPADIPTQEIMTRDNVSVYINGVAYFKVIDPKKAIMDVKDPYYAVSRYAQTALRDVIGTMSLDEVLSERELIAKKIEEIVDKMAHKWGIDIESVKIQDITLPDSMKRAMARQAEAEREKRGLIIRSEGEVEAAKNLLSAAKQLSSTKGSFYLRSLSTFSDIASDKGSKKNFYILPPELLEALTDNGNALMKKVKKLL